MTSWAKRYDNIASLKQEADVVVVGTITSIAAVIQNTVPGTGMVSTEYVFEVDQVIWNPQHQLDSASIFIHQKGGMSGNIRQKVVGIPLFDPGERSLLFLKRYEPGGAEHYSAFGGHPAARFTVQNGLVHPMKDSSIRFVAPLTEAEFIISIQNA